MRAGESVEASTVEVRRLPEKASGKNARFVPMAHGRGVKCMRAERLANVVIRVSKRQGKVPVAAPSVTFGRCTRGGLEVTRPMDHGAPRKRRADFLFIAYIFDKYDL